MPRVSTAPLFNKIARIAADYVVAPSDFAASIKSMPARGITVFLPGPTAPVPPGSQPVENPGDGDFYHVWDPGGLVGFATPLTVDGGGFKFAVFGTPSTVQSIAPFSNGGFWFDDDAQVWVPCLFTWSTPET